MEMLPLSGMTACLGSAGLAEGTNANTFQLARAISYAIRSKAYYKAATDNIAFSAGHTALAASQSCVFLVCINASGTVSTIQGDIVANADVGVSKSVPTPDVPADLCPIGIIQVSTNASGAFTPGSTDLGASNVFDGYTDFALGIPPRPNNTVLTS